MLLSNLILSWLTLSWCPPGDGLLASAPPPSRAAQTLNARIGQVPTGVRLGMRGPGIAPLTFRAAAVRPRRAGMMQGGGVSRLMPLAALRGVGAVVAADGEDKDAVEVRNIEAGGPWLGIQFGPIPKPLAAHLELGSDRGQMVLNVGVGSPADDAGFQQYDVIVSVDGKDVSSDIAAFLDIVRGFNPGERHTFTLIRAAKKTTAEVTVGTRPDDPSEMKYKYEIEGEDLKQDQTIHRGGMLQKDPQGNWTFKGIDPRQLPDVWKSLPQTKDFQWWSLPDKGTSRQFYMYHSSDGRTIRIEQKDGGQIVVSKTLSQGDKSTTTTKTYADADALKADDPESYKVYSEGGAGKVDLFGALPGGKVYLQQLPGGVYSYRIPDMSDEVRKRLEDAQREMQEVWKDFDVTIPGDSNKAWARAFAGLRKPSTSFETLENGKIRVTVRQGEDERVDVYESVEAMKDASPELYEKYQALQDVPAPAKAKPKARGGR